MVSGLMNCGDTNVVILVFLLAGVIDQQRLGSAPACLRASAALYSREAPYSVGFALYHMARQGSSLWRTGPAGFVLPVDTRDNQSDAAVFVLDRQSGTGSRGS